MKKLKLLLLLLFLFGYSSCENTQEVKQVSMTEILNDSRISTINIVNNDVKLLALYNSDEWESIPEDLKDRIDKNRKPQITRYKNSIIEVISFKLFTTLNYESLVFYTLENKYIPAITKSENQGDLVQLSVTNIEGLQYFEFFVNKEGKFGKFKMSKNIEFTSIASPSLRSQVEGSQIEDGDSCPKKTIEMSDCMMCAIKECSGDWVCAVVCAVMSPECLAGFILACAVG